MGVRADITRTQVRTIPIFFTAIRLKTAGMLYIFSNEENILK